MNKKYFPVTVTILLKVFIKQVNVQICNETILKLKLDET